MIRVMPTDVVNAYKQTGLIPIRRAWQSLDDRGGCAIDALARCQGEDNGEEWSARLGHAYLKGFLDAWDAETPLIEGEVSGEFRQGFWDAVLCRAAVEKEYSSITTIDAPETSL